MYCRSCTTDIKRQACTLGCKCRQRETSHLDEFAHPFDHDYEDACKAQGVEPEELSLRGLFTWVDLDSSGRVSKTELETAIPLLLRIFGEDNFQVSDTAWETLDEDGNGIVNFSEFAEWAGPRLGLPLGVQALFKQGGRPCRILGCPCENFVVCRTSALLLQAVRGGNDMSGLGQVASQVVQKCKCGHKRSAHAAIGGANDGNEVPYPMNWTDASSDSIELVPLDAGELGLFQELLDGTYRNIWTRDRRKHNPSQPNVPTGFTVTRVVRAENSRSWREYCVRRAQLCKDLEGSPVETFTDVLPTVAMEAASEGKWEHLRVDYSVHKSCNEWYLLHGTRATVAETICRSDFKISLAGGNTGTLYGRGVYLAESITKADEYSKPNAEGEYAVLLVRALGGKVHYTDEVVPDAEELVRSCIEGPYDCILGDRRKCRGTFREFVFYDTEDMYAEYILYYRRVYREEAKPPAAPPARGAGALVPTIVVVVCAALAYHLLRAAAA